MTMNFSEHTKSVFAELGTDYDSMNNLMQDVALGREIYDAESERVISKAEANAKILEFSRRVLGITNPSDAKEVRRALEDNGKEWFRIIEDTIDNVVTVGLQNSDWFNELVDSRQIGYHDRLDFIADTDALLAVAIAGTQHNDHSLQRLAKNQPISIPTELHVIKVGATINRFIVGQEDWSKLVDAIAKSYENDIQNEVYAELAVAQAQLPAQFKGTGSLTTATKPQFDALIEKVSAANNGAEVVIMGTKPALSNLTAISNVQWAADGQKNAMMNTGTIGIYEGTRLMVIPNKFRDQSMTQFVFPTDEIMIVPVVGDAGKFIKFVDEGDTMISEITERDSKYTSDLQTYQVQRRYGVGVVLGRNFGFWDKL